MQWKGQILMLPVMQFCHIPRFRTVSENPNLEHPQSEVLQQDQGLSFIAIQITGTIVAGSV